MGWVAVSAGLVFGLAMGSALGFAVFQWRAARQARQRRRIPRNWSLDARSLANSAEGKVWQWLSSVFPEYRVMVKVPVTRFTIPRYQAESEHWYGLLSGVYCTLTVCTASGHVLGCVDVPTMQGLSSSNRQLKRSLLAQCGIRYWVVDPFNLPESADIRADLLGVRDTDPGFREDVDATIAEARVKLRKSVEQQRLKRNSRGAPLAPRGNRASPLDSENSRLSDSRFGATGSWQQPDSFMMPLDSRHPDLE
jgi:hypothetical protein